MSLYSKGSVRRNVLQLVPTERCNLACVYCYETTKNTRKMPLSIAKAAIEKAMQDVSCDELEIHFHGGEPFFAFREIKELCEWLWSEPRKKPYVFFATTNGTLIRGKIRRWIEDNHHRFILSLSADGTPEMHDANRSGSFSKIDFDLFRTLYPFQPVKMTLSRQTLPTLSAGVIYLHHRGFRVSCNNAYGIEWNDDDVPVFSRELKKLADFYISNPTVEPCPIVTMPIEVLSYENAPRKWCGSGTTMTCVDQDGTVYPCHAFMPSSNGTDIDIQSIWRKLQSDDILDEGCVDCVLAPCCPTCYGMNQIVSGNINVRNKVHCSFSKIRAYASAYLLSEMLIRRDTRYKYLADKSDTELYHLALAAKIVATRSSTA